MSHNLKRNLLSVQFKLVHEIREENKEQLFLEALESTRRGYVLYISSEEITDIPAVPAFNRNYLKMLTFLYLNNFDALIEGLSTIPEWRNAPTTIIVDGLNKYCLNDMQIACGAIALMLDIARSCSMSTETVCKLVVSVDKVPKSYEFCHLLKELYGQL